MNLKAPSVGGIAGFLRSQRPYFWVIVIWGICFLYYMLIAADRYAPEAKVYVKSVKEQGGDGMSALSMLTGTSSGTSDMALLQNYLRSHDLLTILDERLDLRGHYTSDLTDFYSGLGSGASEEDFLDYYRKHVMLELDPLSGILSVRAQGFSREFSLALTKEMLVEGEAFINKVGQEIATQEIKFVEHELDRAKADVQLAQRELLAFQSKYQTLSPQAEGQAFQQVMTSLRSRLVQLRAEEKVLKSYLNENASEVVAVRARIDAIEEQLASEQGKLTVNSTDEKTIGEVNLDYQELELKLKFATEIYKIAFATLEKTKVDAYRKLKHLVVVQRPTMPEEASFPRRGYILLTIFVVLTLTYGIAALVVATVREHRDV
ncbi:hypothetical protein [Kordiimonas sp.]|uniref:hypothetical protein n=1 Tax=Kordiimonas sp. TaxID=1970157 RepID=UPI003A9082C9